MSYYSDICIILKESDFRTLCKEARERDIEEGKDIYLQFIQEAEIEKYVFSYHRRIDGSEIEPEIAIHWNCIKWYPTYEDVNFVVKKVRSFPDYYYGGIGESTDDTWEEQDGFINCSPYVNREIVVDCSTPPENVEALDYINEKPNSSEQVSLGIGFEDVFDG